MRPEESPDRRNTKPAEEAEFWLVGQPELQYCRGPCVEMVAKDEVEQDVIQAVRILVAGEKDLECPTTDEYLIRFIRACNYDVKLSHQLVKDYFKARIDHSDVFVFGPASSYESVISRQDLGFVHPGYDNGGRRVCLLRLGDIDPSHENFEILIQTATLALEGLSLEPKIQEGGICLILDCTNFSLKIMKWATPNKLKVVMALFQEAIPLRFDVIHIVNAPLVFNIFYTALKPFMKDDFVQKLVWHRGPYAKLHKNINSEYLPPWMGGTLDINTVRYWYKDILEKEAVLSEFSKMGYKKRL